MQKIEKYHLITYLIIVHFVKHILLFVIQPEGIEKIKTKSLVLDPQGEVPRFPSLLKSIRISSSRIDDFSLAKYQCCTVWEFLD